MPPKRTGKSSLIAYRTVYTQNKATNERRAGMRTDAATQWLKMTPDERTHFSRQITTTAALKQWEKKRKAA